ncbi:MAG TPA: G1 family glutamic endopeptidase [Mycobacteriales bacterium]|nr:G1 family glutamic endopeptidase [Mycobacteriales bacterium]
MRARRGLIALVLPVAAALSVPAALGSSAGAATLKATSHRALIPTKGEVLPMRNADATSLNWAGYAVTGSTITGVTQSWIVPTAGLIPPGFSSTWAGIGGYTSSDLIQAGTTQDSLPVGGSQYYAWWETLPDAETPITSGCTGADPTCAIAPGDHMHVDIHQVGNNVWSITLSDNGKWSWQSPNISYASTHSSAEWIHEAPTFVVQTILAGTGTTYIGPYNTYTDGSGTHYIKDGAPISIAMGPGVVNEATPSALAPDSAFYVCAYKQSCAAPAS